MPQKGFTTPNHRGPRRAPRTKSNRHHYSASTRAEKWYLQRQNALQKLRNLFYQKGLSASTPWELIKGFWPGLKAILGQVLSKLEDRGMVTKLWTKDHGYVYRLVAEFPEDVNALYA